ncbi:MAG: BtpA/SgcQ family protein [candidate division KSB1 bacterium]|nr:BtpA/SgcQ family protein [candidate division KSB1 bacterium]
MQSSWLEATFGLAQPLIGMVHVRPLPGSPGYSGDMQAVIEAAVRDARALAEAGFDGLLIENFGDTPFFPEKVPDVTVASMTLVCDRVRQAVGLPVGVNVLRNDAMAALSIATVVGARFIRVNILAGASVTDQGLIQGKAHELLRARKALGSEVYVLADVLVKHAAPLGSSDVVRQSRELVERAHADAIIITGKATGDPPAVETVAEVRQALPQCLLLVGSGVNPTNVQQFRSMCDGFIVGTCLKEEGQVSVRRARELVQAVRGK